MRRTIVGRGVSGIHAEKIPYELWLQIIECSSLDYTDISHLTLVSKFLHFVAQPFLFSTFQISLVRVRAQYPATDLVPCQEIAYHDRLKKRLEFASLPRVVRFVKAFVIRMGGNRVDLGTDDVIEEKELLEMVFQNIGRFTNLRSFSAQHVSLTGTHFDSLAKFEYLTEIHLERCQCTGELGLARFQLKSLSLHGRMTGTHGWWIPLLKCPSIKQLSYDAVGGSSEDPELFFPALATGPIMRSLKTFRMPALATSFPCFVLALSRCPLLENLCFASPSLSPPLRPPPPLDTWPLLPPGYLSNLQAINAPSDLIQYCILRRETGIRLKHITISNMLRYTDGILGAVRDTCPELEELVMCVTQFPLDTFPRPFWVQAVFTAFPKLRGLHVTYGSIHCSYDHVRGSVSLV